MSNARKEVRQCEKEVSCDRRQLTLDKLNHQTRSSPVNLLKRHRKILLLHGNQQTGDILLGRIEKLKKTLWQKLGLDIVAPDAPHLFSEQDDMDCVDADVDVEDDSDKWKRTWWHRRGNTYRGMEESVSMLDQLWINRNQEFVAIFGFSQGSRLAHIISIIHTITNGIAFPGIQCVIHFSGYGDCSLPDNLTSFLKDQWNASIPSSILLSPTALEKTRIQIPSLHVMGELDALIPLKSSEALMKCYVNPTSHIHPGNHFVPVKRLDIDRNITFAIEAIGDMNTPNQQLTANASTTLRSNIAISAQPDEEHALAQVDEVAALAQIFPSEFRLLSKSTPTNPEHYDPDDYFGENRSFEHPIRYSIILQPQDECSRQIEETLWPPRSISLCIQYPAEYPDVEPLISLIHDMNYFEFSMETSNALMDAVRKAMMEEAGMPCGMGMVYAARSFFQEGGLATCRSTLSSVSDAVTNLPDDETELRENIVPSLLKLSNPSRIKLCNAQGLQIASTLLSRDGDGIDDSTSGITLATRGGKGGIWRYTVGLIGKPSAGKSTFFNAATAFARQRGEGDGYRPFEASDVNDDNGVLLGGASMAAHPFTTIDPNIGYCLIPAPPGACPEDEENAAAAINQCGLIIGSSHGRDSNGRRLIPACLKDVAGLVPGAYQGRGRGNKFLDDLTDADVLVHIVDASGSSDAEGNKFCSEGSVDDLIHPINDLEWVRNELVEWVYFNVSSKWGGIVRKGKQKLLDMFSGYKQNQAFTYDVFIAVEKFVKENEGRERIFDDLESWDDGDLHRLVSAFLGARFPMALAMNKSDIPPAEQHISDINSKLPLQGAHVGVGMSAHEEMMFVRQQVMRTMKNSSSHSLPSQPKCCRVWDCLQAAMTLREPVVVFPVNNWKTYEPIPGMANYTTRDSSLPNHAFVNCIIASGGCAPSQWSNERCAYVAELKDNSKDALRDVLLMKPGSTVEHAFQGLKGMGVLDGDFVRAEAACLIGDKPKPVLKSDIIQRHNRILRIMTTKKKTWQKH